ncbi:MAG: response regulator [Hyphomicrobiales bacterium]
MSEVNVPLEPHKPDLVEEDRLLAMMFWPGKFRTIACLGLLAVVLFAAFFLQEFNVVLVGILGLLATIGVFAVLAYSAGILDLHSPSEDANIFAAYADNLTDGMLITNKKGDVLYANDAYFHILRKPRDKVISSVETFFSGEPAIAEPVYRLCQAATQLRDWEEEVFIHDGDKTLENNMRWVRISVRPIFAKKKQFSKNDKSSADLSIQDPTSNGRSAGDVAGVVWRLTDITLERAQRDLEYKELTNAVSQFDAAPLGFFTFNSEGELSYMNHTLSTWLGRSDRMMDGRLLSDLMPMEGVQLLQQSLVPHASLRSVQYYDLICEDGSTLSTILYGRPHEIVGSDEPHYGVLALRAEDAPQLFEPQRMTEMRLEQFYQTAPIGIATINGSGDISNANGSFRVLLGQGGQGGQSGSEVEQTDNLFELIELSAKEALKTALDGAADGSAVISPVDVKFNLNGERSGRLYLSPARDMAEDGAVAIIYAIDTSKQRALEEQFAQSQKMQAVGQLAGGIAHDFNNVLTAIIGYTDLLIGSHRPTDPSFKDMMHIKQNANRAARLVRQLLAFSRQQTLRLEVLSLHDVIKDVTAMLSRLLGEKIELKVEHGRDLWEVKADHHQFDQVIINLAVNARDAMLEGMAANGLSDAGIGSGTLTLRTENIAEHRSLKEEKRGLKPGEYVLLEVTDTGCGMPQETIDKIFEPFFTTKDIGKGTGLGLSMVYGIVKQTDGYIFVDSAEGQGTTFKIYLPRHVADEVEATVDVPVQIEEKPKDLTGSETLLLVEDEEAVRSFAVRALSMRGYNVLEANSGTDALDVVAAHDGGIDLVISDVMMPEMDGPTMLTHLRDSLPDVKVIFISGYAEDAFEKNLGEGETFTFLPKPFSLKQLAATVKDVLEAN